MYDSQHNINATHPRQPFSEKRAASGSTCIKHDHKALIVYGLNAGS